MPFTFNFGGFNPADFGFGEGPQGEGTPPPQRPKKARKPRKPIGIVTHNDIAQAYQQEMSANR